MLLECWFSAKFGRERGLQDVEVGYGLNGDGSNFVFEGCEHDSPAHRALNGRTPLHWAIVKDDPAMVRLLIEYRADRARKTWTSPDHSSVYSDSSDERVLYEQSSPRCAMDSWELAASLGYGNFDIILDHFSRIFQLQPTPHALWAVFYLVPRLT